MGCFFVFDVLTVTGVPRVMEVVPLRPSADERGAAGEVEQAVWRIASS